ncbi:hypothetical protein NEF87_004840 [Candidatus Lokiarchaeum ossiferum]|uniref:HD-CE domain-containing protein n=1 Tax=Candidatus Lokiarchaeum ossiferum TaxID=2951803 RepID=A0ABY6HYG7_9ARCH|nr:hypothetical protein NEF87_004840 [Candidatus Lokiarchaeum sp. B-35]
MQIQETKLWNHLNDGRTKLEKILAINILQITPSLLKRSKLIRDTFPHFTLHDENHLIKVIYIMGILLEDHILNELNPIEIYLLILSALFHDQGMVVEDQEKHSIQNSIEYINSVEVWKENNHNLKLSEIERDYKFLIEYQKDISPKIEDVLYFSHF